MGMMTTRGAGEEKTPAVKGEPAGAVKAGRSKCVYRYDVLRPYSMVVALG